MKTSLNLLAFVLLATGVASGAQDVDPPREPANRPNARPSNARAPADGADASGAISRIGVTPARTIVFTPQAQAAARAFVQNNRPEMVAILDQLQQSKPAEYQQVICDLFRTSENFTNMRQTDRGRHEIALKTWQSEAKTHLLAAELAAHPDRSESIKIELRATVEILADLEVEQAAYELRQLEAKVRRAEGQKKKFEAGRGEFVENRLQAILQAIGRSESGAEK